MSLEGQICNHHSLIWIVEYSYTSVQAKKKFKGLFQITTQHGISSSSLLKLFVAPISMKSTLSWGAIRLNCRSTTWAIGRNGSKKNSCDDNKCVLQFLCTIIFWCIELHHK